MKKTVLVTGASKGIGKAIALNLARDGFEIAIHYNNDKAGAAETLELVRGSDGDGRLLRFDISDRDQCRNILEAQIEEFGALYGVVLNAGIIEDTAFPAMTDGEWDRVIHTNLDGFYNILQPTVMPMIRMRQGGRIVVLSSLSGIVGNRGQVNYSASKAGLIGAAKSLAIELGKRKITVNCVAPGLIETEMLAALPVAELIKSIPLQRLGTPQEVASTVSFLCSPEAAYITRQVISINGGMI